MRPLPRPKIRALQWVFSGLSEVAPHYRNTKKGRNTGEPLTSKDKRLLRKLRAEARLAGRDPERVALPSPPPEPPRARLAASRLDLLPPPKDMDAAALGRAANVAAREPAGSSHALWASLVERAQELLPTLDTQDLALILNGMARVRYEDPVAVEQLRASVLARMAYFSSRHFAMAFSAFARFGLPESARETFILELEGRVGELQSATELTMILTSLSRLQVADPSLVASVAVQIDNRLSAGQFHVKDVACVASAYARLRYSDGEHLERIARCATATLEEATPRELAQVVLAAALVGTMTAKGKPLAPACAELAERALPLAAEKVRFMLPAELVDTAFAFGHAVEADLCASSDGILLLSAVAHEAAKSCNRFTDAQLIGVLRSFARWRVPTLPEDLTQLAETLCARTTALPEPLAAETFYSLARLLPPGYETPEARRRTADAALTMVGQSSSVNVAGSSDADQLASDVVLKTSKDLAAVVCRGLAQGHAAFDSEDVVRRVVEAAFSLGLSDEAVIRDSVDGAGAAAVGSFEDNVDSKQTPPIESGPSMAAALSRRLGRQPKFDTSAAYALRHRLLELGGKPSDPLLHALADYCGNATE